MSSIESESKYKRIKIEDNLVNNNNSSRVYSKDSFNRFGDDLLNDLFNKVRD